MEILGDVSGIRSTQLKELKSLTSLRTERPELINYDLLKGICSLTSLWNKEIAVFINRSGIVNYVAVGQHAAVKLPQIPLRQAKRMRCIHTHPSGNFKLSTVDISALTSLGLESMTSLGVRKGKLTGAEIAYISEFGEVERDEIQSKELENFVYDGIPRTKKTSPKLTKAHEEELGFLVALAEEEEGRELLEELAELSRTAGVKVVGQILQPRRYGNSSSYLGKGKLQELQQAIQNSGANVLICDDELTPVQQRTLESKTGIKVLDRTTLILDIFAQRAKSKEGKLQVELAQLKHLLPHLVGQGLSLSRLGGGVGTRGPGETKLEIDRRRVRQKIDYLQNQLKDIRKVRTTQRRQRLKSGMPLVSLVGYTNAGKTTFLQKALELHKKNQDKIQGEDKLFATLDPIVKGVKIKHRTSILLSDTVGFIQKLPHQLIQAFLATLEEVQNADLLIHVLDVSHPNALKRADTVQRILGELGCSNKPQITLLNKVDKVENPSHIIRIAQELPNPIPISLVKDKSLDKVWDKVTELLGMEDMSIY